MAAVEASSSGMDGRIGIKRNVNTGRQFQQLGPKNLQTRRRWPIICSRVVNKYIINRSGNYHSQRTWPDNQASWVKEETLNWWFSFPRSPHRNWYFTSLFIHPSIPVFILQYNCSTIIIRPTTVEVVERKVVPLVTRSPSFFLRKLFKDAQTIPPDDISSSVGRLNLWLWKLI